MFSSSWIKRLLVFSSACLLAATVQATPAFSNIYVLGDSLSDQGNLFDATQALTGVGIPDGAHYANGRFSNGENYAGLLAQRLGLSLAATLRGGNNFAYGGTRTDYNVVEGPKTPGGFDPGTPGGFAPGTTGYNWTLNLQRQDFAARHIFDPFALYVVFSGSNDIADLLRQAAPLGRAGFAATAAQSMAAVQGVLNVVDAYKNAGARYVLVPNIPDLGVIPSVTNVGSAGLNRLATALSQRFNTSLDAGLNAVSGVQIIRFDTFGFVDQVHDHPADFALTNVNQPCYTGFVDPTPSGTVCGNPDQYAYWDAEHPTTALHSILADRLLAALDANIVPEPESGALVLVALGAMAFIQRRRAGAIAA